MYVHYVYVNYIEGDYCLCKEITLLLSLYKNRVCSTGWEQSIEQGPNTLLSFVLEEETFRWKLNSRPVLDLPSRLWCFASRISVSLVAPATVIVFAVPICSNSNEYILFHPVRTFQRFFPVRAANIET